MNRFSRQCLLAAAIACLVMLSGCFSKGESADPPPGGLTAAPGDGFVTLSWQPESGVEYWLFWAPGTIVDVNHPVFIKSNATTPFVIGGLVNGVTYAFTINGRKDQGPGGSPAPTVTATPRPVGEVWQVGGTAGTADLKAVAYGTAYDAVGNAGALFQSADGITWTPATGNWAALAGSNNFNAIIYNATLARFIAVGDAGLILYSTDNTNWTAGTYAAPAVPPTRLNALTTDATRVVAVGDAGAIYYSDDSGVTWNAAASVPAGTGNLYGVAFAAGSVLTAAGAATAASSRWVAVGAAGTLITSTDGTNWVPVTSVTPATAADLRGVAFLGSTAKFAAVGAGGEVATSSDGLAWTTQSITTNDLQSVAALIGPTSLFGAVGKSGVAFTSFDGLTWTTRSTGTVSDLYGIINGNGQFDAVGQAGITVYSK